MWFSEKYGFLITKNRRWSALEEKVAAVQSKGGLQATVRNGIAEGKRRKQVAMIDRAAALAGDLLSMATAEGNAELAGRTDFYKTDLVEMADAEVGPACQNIVDLAKAHAAKLAGLGTTAEDLAAAQAAIDAYTAVVAAPRVAIGQGKTLTGDIAALLAEIDELYARRLDPAMRKFALKDKAFFDDYRNARTIVDLGTRHEEKEEPPVPA